MRIEKAPYYANIVKVRRGESVAWEWLVKRIDSEYLLTQGEELSEARAVQSAIECLEKLIASNPA
jgi:hypothetical protein